VALRCLIVDDSVYFAEVARSLLEREAVAVVGVAATLAEGLRQADELQPDVVLVDIDLGEDSGLELARRLGAARSVILISTHVEADYADLVAESPAVGFISKSDLSGRAIHDVLDGRARHPG
jgi:DNA-binding NarL/FixJ family response regulator